MKAAIYKQRHATREVKALHYKGPDRFQDLLDWLGVGLVYKFPCAKPNVWIGALGYLIAVADDHWIVEDGGGQFSCIASEFFHREFEFVSDIEEEKDSSKPVFSDWSVEDHDELFETVRNVLGLFRCVDSTDEKAVNHLTSTLLNNIFPYLKEPESKK